MAVTQIRRFSSWTLLLVMIISVGVLALFYLGGVVDPAAETKEPIYTSELLYWCYLIAAVTIVGMLVFGILQFVSSLQAKPKAALGSLIVLIVFAGLLVITYVLGDATPLPNINTDSAHFNTEKWLKISDMWIYSIYVVLFLCILAMIAGSIKSVLKK
ncbi:MAG: hypothetical protein LBF85_10740 [Tannerella sp.]|jgi:magnesium-transporting ATPase (P-type)|nr:hypothetical protein [Tannerella sp.]